MHATVVKKKQQNWKIYFLFFLWIYRRKKKRKTKSWIIKYNAQYSLSSYSRMESWRRSKRAYFTFRVALIEKKNKTSKQKINFAVIVSPAVANYKWLILHQQTVSCVKFSTFRRSVSEIKEFLRENLCAERECETILMFLVLVGIAAIYLGVFSKFCPKKPKNSQKHVTLFFKMAAIFYPLQKVFRNYFLSSTDNLSDCN